MVTLTPASVVSIRLSKVPGVLPSACQTWPEATPRALLTWAQYELIPTPGSAEPSRVPVAVPVVPKLLPKALAAATAGARSW